MSNQTDKVKGHVQLLIEKYERKRNQHSDSKQLLLEGSNDIPMAHVYSEFINELRAINNSLN